MFWAVHVLLLCFLNSINAEVIIELTDADIPRIKEIIHSGDNAMLYFYSQSCMHCSNFSNTFNILADKSAEYTKDPSMAFYRIDVDASPELTIRFFVRFIPALFHLKSGKTFALKNEDRADLAVYFKERAWTRMKPVGWLMGPFGLWGTFFGYFTRLINSVMRAAEERNISNIQLILICAMITLLFWIFAAFLGYITRPVEKKENKSSKKKRE